MEGPTAVIAKFDYTYDHHGQTISIRKGESFNLLAKATSDWWHVRRRHGEVLEDLYVPATYVREVKNIMKAGVGSEMTRRPSLPHGIQLAGQAEPKEGNSVYENVARLRGGSPGPFHSPPVAKKPQLAVRQLALGQNAKERPKSFFGSSENSSSVPHDLLQSIVTTQPKLAPKTGRQYEGMQLKSPSTGQSAADDTDGPTLSPTSTVS